MTGQSTTIQTLPLDGGLSDLLALRSKQQSGAASGTGSFMDILDQALRKESLPPAKAAESTGVSEASGIVQGQEKTVRDEASQPGSASGASSSASKDALASAQAKTAENPADQKPVHENPAALVAQSADKKRAALVQNLAGQSKRVEVDPAVSRISLEQTKAKGLPGLNSLPDAQVQGKTASRTAELKTGAEEALVQASSKNSKTKTKEKTAQAGDGSEKNLVQSGIIQTGRGDAASKAKGEVETEKASGSPLLGKALETIKALGAQLDAQSTQSIKELKLDDLLLSRNSMNLVSTVKTENPRNKAGVELRDLRDDRFQRSTESRLKASRNPHDLAQRVEVTDQRGMAVSSAQNLSTRNFVQNNEMSQAAAQQSQVSAKNSGESKSSSFDLGMNAPYVPAKERVLHMPVMSTQNGTSQTLKDWLRGQGGKQIANEASILLQDGGNGEIKLILHPDELGEVQIKLQMKDGSIAGDIFVENEEVRQAFQDQIQSLSDAFKDSGFGNSSFNVSLGNQSQQNLGQFSQGKDQADQRRPDPHAIKSLESHIGLVQDLGYGNAQIDLVV